MISPSSHSASERLSALFPDAVGPRIARTLAGRSMMDGGGWDKKRRVERRFQPARFT